MSALRDACTEGKAIARLHDKKKTLPLDPTPSLAKCGPSPELPLCCPRQPCGLQDRRTPSAHSSPCPALLVIPTEPRISRNFSKAAERNVCCYTRRSQPSQRRDAPPVLSSTSSCRATMNSCAQGNGQTCCHYLLCATEPD